MLSRSSARVRGSGLPAIAAIQTSSVNTSRSAIIAALGSSPSNQTATKPGPQRALELGGGQRGRRLEQLAHAVEMVRYEPFGEVAPPHRLARTRDQPARRRVEVDAVGRLELRSAPENELGGSP